MALTLMNNSRVATGAAVVALVAGLGLSALAQGTATGGQQQGRAGGAGGGQAQQPTRDTQAPAQVPATGVIGGVVTIEGAGTPLRRARITASAPELRGGRSTITDDQGKFSLAALPAGRFTITASKAGYIDIPYGAKKAGRPGTPIQLAAGQKMEKANIAIPKGGVITGVVVDDNGEPTPRAQVRVMKYVMRTGEKTLQQSGTDMTDDRGVYRIYGLLPGDYLVSAIPQNQNIGDLRQTVMAEVESLLQQAQAGGLGALAGGGAGAGGGRGAGGGGGRGGGAAGAAGIDLQAIMGGRGGGPGGGFLAQAQQLQEQLAQQEGAQPVAYAPVYYPGTPTPSAASPVTLAVAEERSGVDFRLTLVPTAKIEGSITSPAGEVPQGTQISLVPLDQANTPPVPGLNTNTTRLDQTGKFTFRDIPPGRYRAMARGAVRDPNAPVDPNGRGGRGGPGGQGPGGRGGPGQVSQVLWGSADIDVNGQDVHDVAITLQEGMTITGRIVFDSGSALPPADLSTTRVNLSPRGAQQAGDIGFVPQATVDAQGRFTIKGVLPGKYTLNAGVGGGGGGARAAGAGGGAAAGGAAAGGGRGGGRGGGGAAAPAATGAAALGTTTQWVLKSVAAGGKDALDFGLTIEPNQDVTATVTFGDKTQGLTGTIQDTMGNPTSDYTIILFAADKGYWVPQARRIQSVRPGTDGKFSFNNLPVGDYRLTAVTDVEPGEWFDPAFLEQVVSASIAVTLKEGEKKTQDMKVAGG